MQLHALRTSWPEDVLTGQYWFQTSGGSSADDVIGGIVSLLTDELIDPDNHTRLRISDATGRHLMNVTRHQGPGIQAVGVRPVQAWIILMQHVRPPQGEDPYFMRRVRGHLTDRRRTWRSRLRRARLEFSASWRHASPQPMQVWDVLDNRLGRIIGRLTVPIGIPNARTAIHGATGRLAAHLMVEGEVLTVRIGPQPVAQFSRSGNAYRVDVAGAGPAGLDPRLVLACAMLQYASLSTR